MYELQPLELVFRNGNEIETDSHRIAKAFGKRHDNVIAAIERLECSPEFAFLNFKECYKNNELSNGKPIKFYRITESGAMLLIMGFTGKPAMQIKEAFIKAFNTMRMQLMSYHTYCQLAQERERHFSDASDSGKTLSKWRWRKQWLDLELIRLEQQIQLSLFE